MGFVDTLGYKQAPLHLSSTSLKKRRYKLIADKCQFHLIYIYKLTDIIPKKLFCSPDLNRQNRSLYMSPATCRLQVHLCNQQWIIEKLKIQITLLSLLLIIPTIEGRELGRISDDGFGGFRREDSSRDIALFKPICFNLRGSHSKNKVRKCWGIYLSNFFLSSER